jgi:hypothetical protein
MTTLRPLSSVTNQEAHGLPLACESVYRSEIARIEGLRTRQVAYRASLPTTHEAATKEASSVLRRLIEEDEGGQLLEALHLSVALGAMIQKDGNGLDYEGTYRDAAVYISEKIGDALRHVHGELEHMDHVLRTVNGTG